ncbi:MAG: leucine-rich repeat domain-containing protein [Muribaculaceae bacterium]|nr:leucine-rich repeat domain-containing protein [Muribaculaceae bacterium]
MKHPLLIALAALAALTPVHSSARDFSYTYEGQTLTYSVLDEDTKTVETKQGKTVYAGNSVSGNLFLPAHPMDGDVEYTLTTIGENAFYACKDLTSVEIPNSVTTIGFYSFSDCKSLTKVEIPNSVKTIEDGAFNQCAALTSVEMPNSVTTIGNRAFSGCTALTSVEIPNSVTTIGEFAFSGTTLRSVQIPSSVTIIGNHAFVSGVLIEINVDSGNQYYSSEDGVLFNSDKTILIEYPAGRNGSYTISNSVSAIGEFAFCDCQLTHVEIPNSVTSIGKGAFCGCQLTHVEIPNSVMTIENRAFAYCSDLTNVEIPNSVTTIGEFAFSFCFALTSVQIPNSVTTIGKRAFTYCWSLSNVEIPNSVTSIGEWAFDNCTALKNVICLATIPPIVENGVFEKNEDSYLYVPAASVSAYENSDWAQYFTGIKAIKDELTVEIAGNGKVYGSSLDVIESGSVFGGSQLSFLVLPEAGSRIEAITMDGEDAMDKLTGNKLTVQHNPVESVLSIEFATESEATLTVKGGDSYAATYTYTAGTAATVKIQPESGWKVSTVSYNGADVTDQLEGNIYVTAPLEGENSLNFVLEKKNPTGVDEVGAPDSEVRVSVWQNTVTITGLEPGAQVSVHDVAGNMVYAGNEHSLTLPAGQAYIISTPSKTFKVAL